MSIDSYVIHLCQQVVDALQRRPVVLSRVVAATYIAACAIDLVNRPDPVLMALYPVLAMLMLFFSKSEYRYASLSDSKLTRHVLLALFAAEALGNVYREQVNFASFLASLCVTAYYYFAACTPPKPPKRKEQPFFNLKGQT